MPPPKPCQRKPQWTLLKNDQSYENVLGYSGTNSKYVKIVDSAFYNNGAGIVPNTLDSEGYEPNGWNVFEGNDVFWNNYNYFLSGAAFHTVSGGLGVNWPARPSTTRPASASPSTAATTTWSARTTSSATTSGASPPSRAPAKLFVANEGDDAKNVNNQIVENVLGREGADPNGEYDIWNDASGGGNCWSQTARTRPSRRATGKPR